MHEVRNDRLRQQIEGGRIAEEVRDVDEEVLGQQLALGEILTQDLQIATLLSRPASAIRRSMRRCSVPCL